jgi:hypothetical protein
VLFRGNLDARITLIDRHPNTRFIIDVHHRPSGHYAAARAACAPAALVRPPEGAETRQAPERGDLRGQRRNAMCRIT